MVCLVRVEHEVWSRIIDHRVGELRKSCVSVREGDNNANPRHEILIFCCTHEPTKVNRNKSVDFVPIVLAD